MAEKPAEAPEAPEPSKDASAPEDAKRGKAPLLVLFGGLLIGGGAGAFVVGPMLAGQSTDDGEKKSSGGHGAASSSAFHSHVVEGLIVNPAGTGGTRLLLISIAIEADSEDTVQEAEDRDPEIRDILLSALGLKTIDELTDPGAREALKAELLAAVRALGFSGELLHVHIPQFVVQ